MSKSKAKGSTPESLYGKTGKPIQGTVLQVWSKKNTFDRPEFKSVAWKVLVKRDGALHQSWFNTYQETSPDGTLTPTYIGESVAVDTLPKANSAPVKSIEDFQAKASEKGYAQVKDIANWPPQAKGGITETQGEIEMEDDLELVDQK